MSLLDYFRAKKPESAGEAKRRLHAVIVVERDSPSVPDFLPLLQHELIQVIEKYVKLDRKKINVGFERGDDFSTLEVNVELPPAALAEARAAAR